MDPIETKRLTLRPYEDADWEDVHAYASIPEVSQFDVWGPNSVEDTKFFVAESAANLQETPIRRYDLAICLKNDRSVIGGCSLKVDGQQNDQGSLGYAVNPVHQGSGYASEAAAALIEFAFADLGLELVYAECDTRNTASRRVMEKAGMTFSKVHVRHREVKGVMTGSFCYQIVRSDAARIIESLR